jgi:hypothetical protein
MDNPNKGVCPLGETWRQWDIFHGCFWELSPEHKAAFDKSNAATLGSFIREIRVTWELAADSDPFPTPPKSFKKSHHFHADFNIDDLAVHVDKISAIFFGPLRGFTEYRIFVNGVFAGRGGAAGGTWGSFGNDLPAKALLAGDRVLVLDRESGQEYPRIRLWAIEKLGGS